MGSSVSCDVCSKTLSQEGDMVHELKDGTPEHVCLECFDETKHKGHTLRTVYAVVSEANTARLNASGGLQQVVQLEQAVSNSHKCECGGETVKAPDVAACFFCNKPF